MSRNLSAGILEHGILKRGAQLSRMQKRQFVLSRIGCSISAFSWKFFECSHMTSIVRCSQSMNQNSENSRPLGGCPVTAVLFHVCLKIEIGSLRLNWSYSQP